VISNYDEMTRLYGPEGEILQPGRKSIKDILYGTLVLEEEEEAEAARLAQMEYEEYSGTTVPDDEEESDSVASALPQEIWGMMFPDRDELYIPVADDMTAFYAVTRELGLLEQQVQIVETQLNSYMQKSSQKKLDRMMVSDMENERRKIRKTAEEPEEKPDIARLVSKTKEVAKNFVYDRAPPTVIDNPADPTIAFSSSGVSDNPQHRIIAEWRPEEDKAIEDSVARYGTNFGLAWQSVVEVSPYSYISPRTPSQVFGRWRDVLLPRMIAAQEKMPQPAVRSSAQTSSRKPFKLLSVLKNWLDEKKRPIMNSPGDIDAYCGVKVDQPVVAEHRVSQQFLAAYPNLTQEEIAQLVNPMTTLRVLGPQLPPRRADAESSPRPSTPQAEGRTNAEIDWMAQEVTSQFRELDELRKIEKQQKETTNSFYSDAFTRHKQAKESWKNLPPLPPVPQPVPVAPAPTPGSVAPAFGPAVVGPAAQVMPGPARPQNTIVGQASSAGRLNNIQITGTRGLPPNNFVPQAQLLSINVVPKIPAQQPPSFSAPASQPSAISPQPAVGYRPQVQPQQQVPKMPPMSVPQQPVRYLPPSPAPPVATAPPKQAPVTPTPAPGQIRLRVTGTPKTPATTAQYAANPPAAQMTITPPISPQMVNFGQRPPQPSPTANMFAPQQAARIGVTPNSAGQIQPQQSPVRLPNQPMVQPIMTARPVGQPPVPPNQMAKIQQAILNSYATNT
jgi:hypothetical protein